MTIRLCVFDAYGTLFDVAGAARLAAAEPGADALAQHWPKLAEIWRAKQLEYSWIRALAGAYTDFWTVTGEGLDYAMEALGLDEDALRERLLALYRDLPAYPEVPAMLDAVRASGRQTAILSNGSPDMLASAVSSAGLDGRLDAVLSVEEVGIFKPDRRVYELVGKRFGTDPAEVLFVSSNNWDAAAAVGYGFKVLWVNRAGNPMDRLPWRPTLVAPELSAVPEHAAAL